MLLELSVKTTQSFFIQEITRCVRSNIWLIPKFSQELMNSISFISNPAKQTMTITNWAGQANC